MVSFLKKKTAVPPPSKATISKPSTKAAQVADDEDEDQTPDDEDEDEQPAPKVAKKKLGAFKKGPKWLHKGQDAKHKFEESEAREEARKAEMNLMREFYVPGDVEEQRITFLDGDLDDEGMIDCYVFEQHKVKVGNDWRTFVCTKDDDGWCPICNLADNNPSLVGVLTVMVHTPYTIKSGQKKGQVLENRRMLFKAPKKTIKALTKHAVKKGGLRGCTFDVSRTDEKSPRVGDVFDFVEKLTMTKLQQKYGVSAEDCAPADVGEEVLYRNAEELLELGVGKAATGPGYGKASAAKKKSMADEM